jgi:subtilisin-like proprotein convertase family protein
MPGQDAATPLAALPPDPGVPGQWHLRNPSGIDTNVASVWADYTGRGVRIGIVDDGFDLANRDLAGVFGTGGWDARGNDASPAAEAGDRHGTAVAGIIGADANGTGLVGVAHDATLVGFRIGFGASGTTDQLAAQLRKQVGVDISNNSWGFGGFFTDNFATANFVPIRDALVHATAAGREGLGTVFVFAAGNARTAGDNVNHHGIQAAPQVITVGAVDATGKVAPFSTPGAALLVSAAGVNMITTDRVGAEGYASGDTATVSGTSFAAPVVSGVVALMLEANPGLGWRDVQEILALSARQTDAANASWLTNGAGGWNGGGMRFSNDYGFGIVDARAAVRLAETWERVSTTASQATVSASNGAGGAIPDGTAAGFVAGLTLAGGIAIEKVQVTLDIRHTWIGDLRVMLVSPEGTESVLIDRPGRTPGSTGYGSSVDDIRFTVTSNAFLGEGSGGAWTLKVVDLMTGDTGRVVSWSLTARGAAAGQDDTYVFTDAYAALRGADASRGTIADLAGTDTINAAAVTGRVLLDLGAGGGTIGGAAFGLAAGTTIETVHGGDGDDVLTGDRFANTLTGGRGNDVLRGGEGDDRLVGGAGNDTLDGGAGLDTAVFAMAWRDAVHAWSGDALVLSLGALGTDRLTGVERLAFDDVTVLVADLFPAPAVAPPGLAATLLVSAVGPGLGHAVKQGIDATLTTAQHGVIGATVAIAWDGVTGVSATVTSAWNTMKVATIRDVDGGAVTLTGFVEVLVESGEGPSTIAVSGSKRGTITTGAGDDSIAITAWSNGADSGGWGNLFTVSTGAGNDSITVTGWNGWSYAAIDAGAGDDRVVGTSGADTIRGGTGNDALAGGAGRDVFVFRRGDGQDVVDDFNPGATDLLRFEGVAPAAVSWSATVGGILLRYGGTDQVLLAGVAGGLDWGLDWADFLFA